MANLFNDISGATGNTPMVTLSRFASSSCVNAKIVGKLEYLNPCGSSKDRVALEMVLDAERRGLLLPGGTIIEPTSGNTGIGLSSVAAARGYKAIIVMPDSMSIERRKLMAAYGAEVVLTPGELGMAGAIAKANEIAAETPGSFIPGQFENPANAAAHFKTTGPEIWEATGGNIAAFVACIGTGGTVTGTGRFLKSKNPDIKIFGVEPAESPLITEGRAAPHKIQGIGANFIPALLDLSVVDEVLTVKGDDAFETSRALGKCEGFFVGISSGAALSAALQIAGREEFAGKTIVVLLTDGGESYLSSGL